MPSTNQGSENVQRDHGQKKPATCGGCNASWFGTHVCHCAADGCHQTFTGPSSFDQHRRSGRCLNPEDVGLIYTERGRWGWKPMTDDARAAVKSYAQAGRRTHTGSPALTPGEAPTDAVRRGAAPRKDAP